MSYIIQTTGGGLFSLFHITLEEFIDKHYNNILNINDIVEFKIIICANHIFNNKHLFDDIFTYNNLNKFEHLQSTSCTRWFTNINKKPELLVLLKTLVHKNKLNDEIITKVNEYVSNFGITENTLAVHIRLTDMNVIHPEYGVFTLDAYINKINEMINIHTNINNIYIASDNTESINKLKEYYKNIIKITYIEYKENDIRSLYENVNPSFEIVRLNYFNTGKYHIQTMIEMLVLSKCSYFIHRVSDFANFAIIYSDTFKVIESL